MSSTIKSLYGKYLTVSPSIIGGSHEVTIEASGTASGNYRLSDLLAALRTEGILPAEAEPLVTTDIEGDEWRMVPSDAVVIQAGPSMDLGDMRPGNEHTAESHRNLARYHAKAAEWYDANPPVDAEQVEAMSEVLRGEHAWGRKASDDMARALYLAGARIEAIK